MRLVAPFGFYGWGNIGDESTLQGFARLVKSHQPVPTGWVASRNPVHTNKVEPLFNYYDAASWTFKNRLMRRWAMMRADATVFPGGTPIMDGLGAWPLNEVAPLVVAASERRQPVVFVGAGTEHLESAESRAIVGDLLAPRVLHWTVRSESDKARLVGCGVSAERVTVAADLAWLLPKESADFGRQALAESGVSEDAHLIGVNLNNERVVLKRDPHFFEKLAAFLDASVEAHGARLLFFCSEVREGPTFDKAAAEMTLSLMKRNRQAVLLPNRYWTPQQLLSVIACCRLVVTMRYHVCLFSVVQHVPFVAIQRSDKVRDLCADIQWPFGVTLDQVEVPTLLQQVDRIEQQRQLMTGTLRDAALRQAQRSHTNHVALDQLAVALDSREPN